MASKIKWNDARMRGTRAAVLMGVLLAGSGCLMVLTAPIRMERREQAAAAFDRLAELTPEQIAGFLDQRMAASLTLTDAQRPRVAEINLAHARKLHGIAASDDGVRGRERAMAKLNDAHGAALKEVFTAEQFTRFLAMQEEMRTALKDAGRPGK